MPFEENKSVQCLIDELAGRINYWRQEGDLSYAETVGVLEILKMDLYLEVQGTQKE